MQKPRCSRCKKPCRALYERQGKTAIATRVPGWASCPQHGPFKMPARKPPPAGVPDVLPVAALA